MINYLTDDEIDVCWKAADVQRLIPSFAEQIQAAIIAKCASNKAICAPRREWASLDGKELERCFHAATQHEWGAGYKWVLYQAIEAALKEKNHD